MKIATTHSLLSAALGLAIAGTALAQHAPTPAQQTEIDAARTALDQAAQRYAQLARKYDVPGAPVRIEKRMLRRPVIGVLLAADDQSGVRITGVTPDSAAAQAGLKAGDRITGVDGKALQATSGSARVDEVRARLATLDANTAIKLGYQRDGVASEVSLTPKVGNRLMIAPEAPGTGFNDNVQVFRGDDGSIEVLADHMPDGPPHWNVAIAPDVRHEIIRLDGGCKDDDCKLPALAEAFRWNGLNLATVDAGLGRYFGTAQGALVLSTGKELEGLQPGDVIHKLDGKPVTGPRGVMEVLRTRKAGDTLAVEFLRDKATQHTQLVVPKALPFALHVPPLPPLSPRPPGAPGMIEHRQQVIVDGDGQVQVVEDVDGTAAMPGTPKPAAGDEQRTIVIVDQDGKTRSWEGKPGDTPPAWVQALPGDGKRTEKRVQVFVDAQGRKTVIEDEDTPPPQGD